MHFPQRRSISASPAQASSGDGEIRDIASQIMVSPRVQLSLCVTGCSCRFVESVLNCFEMAVVFLDCAGNDFLPGVHLHQMLDVTVSQLSNLHPSLADRVTQKQAEVKDCWALLQKTVR